MLNESSKCKCRNCGYEEGNHDCYRSYNDYYNCFRCGYSDATICNDVYPSNAHVQRQSGLMR